MGEMRVRFTLTNATDEVLARHGQITPDHVRSYEASAMVDTGRIRSVVPAQVIQQIGVGIRGQHVTENSDGRQEIVGVTEPALSTWQTFRYPMSW
jgi:hypothetical protein